MTVCSMISICIVKNLKKTVSDKEKSTWHVGLNIHLFNFFILYEKLYEYKVFQNVHLFMDMYEYTEQCTLYNYEHEIFIDYHKWAT